MSMNSNAVKRKYQKCVDRMKSMKKKPEFHGSDLEQIEAYYHIPKEEIVGKIVFDIWPFKHWGKVK